MADAHTYEDSSKLLLEDIAQALGLSKSTVSRAISGKGRISEATRSRVAAYIAENDRRPNVISRSMNRIRTRNFAVVLPDDVDIAQKPFFMILMAGILEVAHVHNYDVILTNNRETDFTEIKRLINQGKVDGVVVTRVENDDPMVDWLKQTGIPYVVNGTIVDEEVPQIDADHSRACQGLTRYLLERMSVASAASAESATSAESVCLMIGDLKHTVDSLRYEGFSRALAEFYEGEIPEQAFCLYDRMDSKLKIRKAFEECLQRGVRVFLCGDDLICSRLLSLVHEAGIQIPGDLLVASFYDSAELENHDPPITAISINGHLLGQHICRILLDAIDRGRSGVAQKTVFRHSLVFRPSTEKTE